jgi:phage terminase small subunit
MPASGKAPKAIAAARRQKFIDELLSDPSMTQAQAAINAGYSAKTAATIAGSLMMRVDVKEALAKQREELREASGITKMRVIQELEAIAFADIVDYIEVTENHGVAVTPTRRVAANKRGAIVGIKQSATGDIEIRLADKLKALELLGKHFGLYTDRMVVAGEVPRIVDDVDDVEAKDKK